MDVPAGLLLSDRDALRNCKVQHWADGSRTITVCSAAVWRLPGVEARRASVADKAAPLPLDAAEDEYRRSERRGKFAEAGEMPPEEYENVKRAVRRARARVRELARANVFSYFVTLTLNGERYSRYDEHEIVRRASDWLHNAVRRYGLAYILVPERHKDGAIHFHGFFNDALPVVDSGTVILPGGGKPRKLPPRKRAAAVENGAHVVFNIPMWKDGFTTAIPLYGDYAAAVAYVLKYIGKQQDGCGIVEKIGGRWFYSGGALKEPTTELCMEDFDALDAAGVGWAFDVRQTGDRYRVIEIDSRGEVKIYGDKSSSKGEAAFGG